MGSKQAKNFQCISFNPLAYVFISIIVIGRATALTALTANSRLCLTSNFRFTKKLAMRGNSILLMHMRIQATKAYRCWRL